MKSPSTSAAAIRRILSLIEPRTSVGELIDEHDAAAIHTFRRRPAATLELPGDRPCVLLLPERQRDLHARVIALLIRAHEDGLTAGLAEEDVVDVDHHGPDLPRSQRVAIADNLNDAAFVRRKEVDHRAVYARPFRLAHAAAFEAPARPDVVLQPRRAVVATVPALDHAEAAGRVTNGGAVENDLAQRLLAVLVLFAQRDRDAVDETVEFRHQPAVDGDVDFPLPERRVFEADVPEERRVAAV